MLRKPKNRFRITCDKSGIIRLWTLSCPFGEMTAHVIIANDGKGEAALLRMAVYDNGEAFELISEDELEARIQTIVEHEGKSYDETRQWMWDNNIWSFSFFYSVRGYNPEGVIADAYATWTALNMIADLSI